jgi:RNA polymerase sigma-70 factor (ECF subfamily)
MVSVLTLCRPSWNDASATGVRTIAPKPRQAETLAAVLDMSLAMGQEAEERRFRALFESEARGVLGYALRRVDDREDAADVVAETFSVAWRRIVEVPPDPEARLWLYGVARRILANQRRGSVRRERLADRMREQLRVTAQVSGAPDDDRALAVGQALAVLPEQDREVLLLANWEGLAPAQIAVVIGVPAATARTRLHRARGRLRAELERTGLVVMSAPNAQTQDGETR